MKHDRLSGADSSSRSAGTFASDPIYSSQAVVLQVSASKSKEP